MNWNYDRLHHLFSKSLYSFLLVFKSEVIKLILLKFRYLRIFVQYAFKGNYRISLSRSSVSSLNNPPPPLPVGFITHALSLSLSLLRRANNDRKQRPRRSKKFLFTHTLPTVNLWASHRWSLTRRDQKDKAIHVDPYKFVYKGHRWDFPTTNDMYANCVSTFWKIA